MAQGHHLVEDAAKGPDVRLLIVRLLLADFRRQVVRCSNGGLGTVVRVLENSCDTEISDLDLAILRHKNVLGLQVAMQNLPVVNMLDGQRHLYEPVKNLVLRVAN